MLRFRWQYNRTPPSSRIAAPPMPRPRPSGNVESLFGAEPAGEEASTSALELGSRIELLSLVGTDTGSADDCHGARIVGNIVRAVGKGCPTAGATVVGTIVRAVGLTLAGLASTEGVLVLADATTPSIES